MNRVMEWTIARFVDGSPQSPFEMPIFANRAGADRLAAYLGSPWRVATVAEVETGAAAGRLWTEEDVATLRELVSDGRPRSEAVRLLGRSVRAVQTKLHRLRPRP